MSRRRLPRLPFLLAGGILGFLMGSLVSMVVLVLGFALLHRVLQWLLSREYPPSDDSASGGSGFGPDDAGSDCGGDDGGCGDGGGGDGGGGD